MSKVEANYQDYVLKQKFLMENSEKQESLKQKVASVKTDLEKAEINIKNLHEDHEQNFDNYVKKAVESDINKLEAEYDAKLKNVQDRINKISSNQNKNERNYFITLDKNKEQIQKLQSYKDKVIKDVEGISKIYPGYNVEAALDRLYESIKGDLINKDIFDLKVPENINYNEGDMVYTMLGFIDAAKIIFNPKLNTYDIITKSRLIIAAVINYLAILGVLFLLFIDIGVLYKIIGIIIGGIAFMVNNTSIKDKPYNHLMSVLLDRKDFYFFVLHGQSVVEKYTKMKLNITTKNADEIQIEHDNKITELNSKLKSFKDTVQANIKLRDKKSKELKSLKEEEQGLLNERQNRALAIALVKKKKERTNYEQKIVKDFLDRESSYNSRFQSANNLYNSAIKNIDTYTAKIEETENEIIRANNEYKIDFGQVSNLANVKSLSEEEKKIISEKMDAVDNFKKTVENDVHEKLLSQYENENSALNMEVKALDGKYKRLLGQLDKLIADISISKEACDELEKSFDKIPSAEETEGALSPNTFIFGGKNDEGINVSVFDHNYKPSMFLYKLNEKNSMGNVTQQLENFLKSLIEGFYRTNAINTVQQSIVDTVTGAKTFQSPVYSSIVKVYEKNSMLRELVEQIEDEIKKVVNSSKGSLAEINKIRVMESDPPYKYQLVYIIVPSGNSGGAIPNIINEDIWRLMYDGDKYGFLPMFFVDESEWKNYKTGLKTERTGIYEKLSNMINSQNIYLVDDSKCTIQKYIEQEEAANV